MAKRRTNAFLMSAALSVAVVGTSFSLARADTLTDALISAYQTSPLLASNQAALRSVDENVPQARAERRPQTSANLSASSSVDYGEFGDRTDSLQATLDASLLLFDNGQTKAAIEAARNNVAAARADLKNVEQVVLFSAVEAFVDVRRDEEFVRISRNDVERLEETLRATQNRFEVGEVTRTDVSQSEAALAESRANLASSLGDLEVSRQAYLAAVGRPADNLETLPPLPALPATLSEANQIGLQSNPQIISAQFLERVAVYNFDRAFAAKGPTLSGTVSTGVQRSNSNQLQIWQGEPFAEVGIVGSVPLYTGGANDSLIRQAQALIDQRRFELQDTARSVTEDVASAWAQLEVSKVAIVARREQAEASRLAAEGVSEEARLGARSTLDVLDADQDRLEAEAEIVDAIRTEYVAAYSLLQAMGLLTVEHLNLGIETYNPDDYFMRVQSGPPGGFDTSVVDRIRSRWER
ncbi:MAG: TolC family outer membrane protein [Pseudomonadota bacterium]